MSPETVAQTPPPARSDVAGTPPAVGRPFAAHGWVLTAGAVAWAAAILGLGIDPHEGMPAALYALASGLFQVGLLCLLRVLWRTRALGEGRLARGVLRVEAGAVLLALGSTAADGLALSDLDTVGWAVLDACWPVSMLGMFLIGIRIAVAGRWTGASRCWPLVAESWAVVTIPSLAIGGETAGQLVGAGHLVVGYAVLGVLVSRKRA